MLLEELEEDIKENGKYKIYLLILDNKLKYDLVIRVPYQILDNRYIETSNRIGLFNTKEECNKAVKHITQEIEYIK